MDTLDEDQLVTAERFFRRTIEQDPPGRRNILFAGKGALAMRDIGARIATEWALECERDFAEYRQVQ